MWSEMAGATGLAAREDKNINETIYVSRVCVRVQAFLREEVREIDRGWYV